MPGVPYWRLSSLYFFYFAIIGIVSPYFGLYLDYLQFQPTQIGTVLALPMLTKIFIPNLWGWLADTSGHYLRVIRIGAFGALLAGAGLFFFKEYWGLLISVALFTIFLNAILPQFEVMTLDALQGRTRHYGRIRLWGSVGFIVATVVLGAVYQHWSVSVLPGSLWLLLALLLLTTAVLPPHKHEKHERHAQHLWHSLRQKEVIWFLFAAFCMHLSHGVYYGFFSLFLKEHGYQSGTIGLFWSIGVVVEIVIFLKAPVILKRFTLWDCYLASVFVATLRWWLIGSFADNEWILSFAQLGHALTFGLSHAVAIEFVRRKFAHQVRGTGQAIYGSMCFGLGGAIGIYACGHLWAIEPSLCFVMSCCVAAIGCIATIAGKSKDSG